MKLKIKCLCSPIFILLKPGHGDQSNWVPNLAQSGLFVKRSQVNPTSNLFSVNQPHPQNSEQGVNKTGLTPNYVSDISATAPAEDYMRKQSSQKIEENRENMI